MEQFIKGKYRKPYKVKPFGETIKTEWYKRGKFVKPNHARFYPNKWNPKIVIDITI